MGSAPGAPVDGRLSEPRLSVALVCPYSLSRPGGVQGQVVGLARALVDRGHRVAVFAPTDGPHECPPGVELVVCGHSVAVAANGSSAPVSLSPVAAARALRSLRRGAFDVVHVHEPFAPGLTTALLLARKRPPMVATFHRSGPSALYRVAGRLAAPATRRMEARCAVSEAAAATASDALGGSYRIVPNAVDVVGYEAATPWPSGGRTILFLGRHEERKGLGVLLEAFAALVAGGRVPGAELWVAGDGPQTSALRAEYADLPGCRWLGVVTEEEKRRRLAAADVLCAPSLGGESFGVVLLEGMAAGALVVASDIDGYRQAAGGMAELVAPGDPGALAGALAAALTLPPDEHQDRIARARAHAAMSGMDAAAGAYEQVYRQVVAGRA